MKAILATLILVSSFTAFAGLPSPEGLPAVIGTYQPVAENVVTGLYGASGDVVTTEFIDTTALPDGKVTEVYNVSLSNGPSIGSASYEVTVVNQTAGVGEGEQTAQITVKLLISN